MADGGRGDDADDPRPTPRRGTAVADVVGRSCDRAISVDEVETYLRCSRRYEFAAVKELAGTDDEPPTPDRLEPLRTAICDALRHAAPADLEAAAVERLGDLWADRDGRYHSIEQRRHERRALEATVSAYAAAVGDDHARGLERLRQDVRDGDLVGPRLAVPSTVRLPEREETVRVDAAVDYVCAIDSDLVGVTFVPTASPLGLLRYRSGWDGDVAATFADHFDDEAERHEPAVAGALLETAAVLEGLRGLRDRHGLEDRLCRYVVVPVGDRTNASVNWVRGTVETTLEPVDLTDVFVDHHAFGMTHEHRNGRVEERLAAVLREIGDEEFDPSPRWDLISEHACGRCPYAVCCPDYIASEVAFDG